MHNMHNITDKNILDAIEFLIAFISTLIAVVLGAKTVAQQFGNRGKLIEELDKRVQLVEGRLAKADDERIALRRDLDKVEAEYDSLIQNFLDRYKTTRSR